jgi:hypothetical protein
MSHREPPPSGQDAYATIPEWIPLRYPSPDGKTVAVIVPTADSFGKGAPQYDHPGVQLVNDPVHGRALLNKRRLVQLTYSCSLEIRGATKDSTPRTNAAEEGSLLWSSDSSGVWVPPIRPYGIVFGLWSPDSRFFACSTTGWTNIQTERDFGLWAYDWYRNQLYRLEDSIPELFASVFSFEKNDTIRVEVKEWPKELAALNALKPGVQLRARRTYPGGEKVRILAGSLSRLLKNATPSKYQRPSRA